MRIIVIPLWEIVRPALLPFLESCSATNRTSAGSSHVPSWKSSSNTPHREHAGEFGGGTRKSPEIRRRPDTLVLALSPRRPVPRGAVGDRDRRPRQASAFLLRQHWRRRLAHHRRWQYVGKHFRRLLRRLDWGRRCQRVRPECHLRRRRREDRSRQRLAWRRRLEIDRRRQNLEAHG